MILLLLISGTVQVNAAGQQAMLDGPQAVTLARLPFVMRNYTQGPGSVAGIAFDATQAGRVGVADVQICYQTNCVTSGSDGAYRLDNLPDGMRRINAESLEYFSAYEDVLIRPFETTQQDIALVNKDQLADVFMRVLLTWDETKTWPPDGAENDLDAHVWLEAPDPPTHITFADRGDCTTFPNACLEVDFRQGYGPETVAIRQLESTVYYFGVLNYNASYNGVPDIVDLQAKVRIFQENGVTYEFDVPTDGVGDFWYVFQLISDDGVSATIIEKNCITTYDENLPSCPVE